MTSPPPHRLEGDLLVECAGWIWEQLQEDGYYVAGELIELVLETERELGIQGRDLPYVAQALADEFNVRGIAGDLARIEARLIRVVLDWEDDFLGFAGIKRAES